MMIVQFLHVHEKKAQVSQCCRCSPPPLTADILDPESQFYLINTLRMFHVESLPGKGCSAVASRDITPGELIIAESPLIVLPWWVRHSMFPGESF